MPDEIVLVPVAFDPMVATETELIEPPVVHVPPVIATLLEVNVLNVPAAAVVAPTVVPLIVPPVIATVLAFCEDIVPNAPATFCTKAVVAI